MTLKSVWRPEDVTADWLTTVLRDRGCLGEDSVTGFTVEPVGTGQMGDSFRFELKLSDEGAVLCPRSVVGKFTAANDQSRATGVTMRTAEVEVNFYREVAPTLPARTPECFFADVDPSTARFVLLLEDLAPREPGDQVIGCSVDESALALEELAKVHAGRWGDTSLEELEWLNRRDEVALSSLASLYPALFEAFVARYSDRLSDGVPRVGERFFPKVEQYLRRPEGPLTIQHADYRVDNLLFGPPGSASVAIVDWQTVTLGAAAADLSYFMGGSLSTDTRRKHEGELVAHYLSALRSLGVSGYSFDDLWLGYRRHAYAGLVMTVGAAILVARTERGDEMFLAMANRHAAHIEDMASEEVLST
jgi:aminoglycoside/choline kinase family phosphotransferase